MRKTNTFFNSAALPFFRSLFDPLLDLAFPLNCVLCDSLVGSQRSGYVCDKCWNEAPVFTGNEPLCRKCGRMLGKGIDRKAESCQECLFHRYDSAIAVGAYDGALRASILAMKSTPFLPQHLDGLIAKRLGQTDLHGSDLVLPVPLSARRRFERGYNQAELIAERVAKTIGLKVDRNSLARVKHTAMHRAGMDRRARELTVVKAFKVMRPNLIRSKNILLVDDVLTSGSTASACAKELKANGAASVRLFTIGRA